MNISKLKISFSRFSDAALEIKARQIQQDMTGNPAFTSPIPTLADLGIAIDAYSVALVNAADLGRINVAEKNQRRETLELLLAQLGMYVMYIANGDTFILTSSGYDLTKQREITELVNPGSVTLGNGITTGAMSAKVKAQAAINTYQFGYTPFPVTEESVWTTTMTTRSKIIFQGLQPGKEYAVRVAVVGRGEEVAYSPIATMFVQ